MLKMARKLSSERIADAKRLREIWNRKKDELGLTQEKFSEEEGWGNQSAVSQYINGKIPLNLPTVLKFAKALRVEPSEISPTLSSLMIKHVEGLQPTIEILSSSMTVHDSPKKIDEAIYFATPSTRTLLKKIKAALESGNATDADIILLDQLIDKIFNKPG